MSQVTSPKKPPDQTRKKEEDVLRSNSDQIILLSQIHNLEIRELAQPRREGEDFEGELRRHI